MVGVFENVLVWLIAYSLMMIYGRNFAYRYTYL